LEPTARDREYKDPNNRYGEERPAAEGDAEVKPPKKFGFPKEARIKTKTTFDAVFREGGKGVTHGLVLYVRPNR